MRLKLSLLTILFSMVSILAIGQVIEEVAPPPPPPPSEEIFMVVEVMPEFPGCETVTNKEERKQCSQEALLAYVYTHLVYPPKAKENGQEGMAVVAFVVAKDGTLEDIKVVRDPGAGMGEAAAAVIHKMNTDNIRWHPGTQGGRAVATRFNLPVRFKLDPKETPVPTPQEEEEEMVEEMVVTEAGVPPPPPMLRQNAATRDRANQKPAPAPRNVNNLEEEVMVAAPPPPMPVEELAVEEAVELVEADKNYPPPPPPPPPPPARSGFEEIFKVVEEMPRYGKAECEAMATKNEKQECAKEAMLSFIYGNLQYPPLAKEHDVEGTVVVTFVVEKNGSVSDIRITRDIGAGCGQEAIRLVERMGAEGQWVAGKQRGTPVRVQYNLPIKFRLDD
ncbi:energy transducer TonB [Lewinella sp. LCG006]|uniref:energy transducer TonB n=1 Tax=Lewinella sp. LCG006 TaxID=3231911 RepID=UPI003460A59E